MKLRKHQLSAVKDAQLKHGTTVTINERCAPCPASQVMVERVMRNSRSGAHGNINEQYGSMNAPFSSLQPMTEAMGEMLEERKGLKRDDALLVDMTPLRLKAYQSNAVMNSRICGPSIDEIVAETVAVALNIAAPEMFRHRKLSLFETLVMSGYTAETPTKTGMYYMVCNENDYEPEMVVITEHSRYGLVLTDDNVSGIPIESYDLTILMWKRFSPGALL